MNLNITELISTSDSPRMVPVNIDIKWNIEHKDRFETTTKYYGNINYYNYSELLHKYDRRLRNGNFGREFGKNSINNKKLFNHMFPELDEHIEYPREPKKYKPRRKYKPRKRRGCFLSFL